MRKILIILIFSAIATPCLAQRSGFFAGGAADGMAAAREMEIYEQELRLRRQAIEMEFQMQERMLQRQRDAAETERLLEENRRLREQLARDNARMKPKLSAPKNQ